MGGDHTGLGVHAQSPKHPLLPKHACLWIFNCPWDLRANTEVEKGSEVIDQGVRFLHLLKVAAGKAANAPRPPRGSQGWMSHPAVSGAWRSGQEPAALATAQEFENALHNCLSTQVATHALIQVEAIDHKAPPPHCSSEAARATEQIQDEGLQARRARFAAHWAAHVRRSSGMSSLSCLCAMLRTAGGMLRYTS